MKGKFEINIRKNFLKENMRLYHRKVLQLHEKIWNKETNSKELISNKLIYSTGLIFLFTNSPSI